MRKIDISNQKLEQLYNRGLKIRDIAIFFNCERSVIYRRMKSIGIIPNRKPGYRISWNGYKLIYVPSHPFADSRGYIREHRLVMEKHLGRYLLPTEYLDHINENKLDNRIENLRFVTIGDNIKYFQEKHGNPFKGKKHTEESKTIIREKRKKQIGENHPFFGKHHTEESKIKISMTKRGLNYAY